MPNFVTTHTLSLPLALHIYVWHDLILARSAQKQNNANEMQSENQYFKQHTNVQSTDTM